MLVVFLVSLSLAVSVAALALGAGGMSVIEGSLVGGGTGFLSLLVGLAFRASLPAKSEFDPQLLMRRLTELEDRIAATSRRMDAVERFERAEPQRGSEALTAELALVSELLRQVAETVAQHEALLLADEHDRVVHEASGDKALDQPQKPAAKKPQNRNLIEVRRSIEDKRVDLYLQPIVTLPQRKVRFYEALSRLRASDGQLMMPDAYIPLAERENLMPAIDHLLVLRSMQIARRLFQRGREAGIFCNIAMQSLLDPHFFSSLKEMVAADAGVASLIIFEIPHKHFKSLSLLEKESLLGLRAMGFQLSVDRVEDFRLNLKEMADLGVRYAKASADLFLKRAVEAGANIHVSDLSGLFERYGVGLIIDHVETEADVIELLDHNVTLAQGFVFSPPRPVRADILQTQDDERLAG